MVMNTFRSKLRRRRNELFKRSSDEENDEWQFVVFNDSIFPAHNTISSHKVKSTACSLTTDDSVEVKEALRPWAVKRASWHDNPPAIPPHAGTYQKLRRNNPEGLVDSTHERNPVTVPTWLDRTESGNNSYPFSVPTGISRPTNLQNDACLMHRSSLEEICEVSSDQKEYNSRPSFMMSKSRSSDGAVTDAPCVPPHGMPTVPYHTKAFHQSLECKPPVPNHAVIPPTPPPLPPHGNSFINILKSFTNDEKASEIAVPSIQFDLTIKGKDIRQGDKNSCGGSKEQRRSDPGGGSNVNHQANSESFDDDQIADQTDQSPADQPMPLPCSDSVSNNLSKSQSGHKKRSVSSINRSESCKEKQHSRKQTRENRKNSDPNIPTSKTIDVDGENPLNFQSGSSSNSSLSQSQESPSNSVEHVQAYASALDNDSDVEADADLPDWTSRLLPQELENLSPKDRKRQDTINEFFHTEQSHVRVLKVLQSLFYQPLRQSCYLSPDLLDRLFPNLDQMLKFHIGFNKTMKKRRYENPIITTVGDIATSMFVGDGGILFQQAAGEFVAYQGGALDDLKQRQKRDQKLAVFLQDQENHHHCRRLQLKDMLPAGFQRLTKYPLLLESLLCYTDRSTQQEEHDHIAKALERSKEILAYVNAAVQDAENHRRLLEIQKRLDQTSLAKNKHGNCEELRGELDLTKHNLIYEGSLNWKTRSQKNIDLHVLILEDCVVLLQKDNDKFILKYHSINKASGKDDNKLNHSPIIKFGTFIFRPVAADKCAFFIVLTQSTLGAQIYELVTISHNERNVWLRHLHDAQSAYESREGRNRRSHLPPPMPDNDDSSTSNDHLREVDDRDVTETDDNSRAKESSDIPSTSPNPTTPSSDDQLKKTESGNKNVGSAPRSRRLQEVQIIQIVEGPALIDPSEVKVYQGVVLSAEPILTPIELLRRKDLKIRHELDEKQNLIADILNIPREHFESVADMASEAGLANRDARELVLGAMYQAKKLQETLNEAQTINVSDIVAAQASTKCSALPLYQAPMEKLLNISGILNQLLDSLLGLVSERDDERDRMRKELVASRERIHQLHAVKDDPAEATGPETPAEYVSSTDTVTPQSSRPNSYLSAASSGNEYMESADQPQDDDVNEDANSSKPTTSDSIDVLNEKLLSNEAIPTTAEEKSRENSEACAQSEDST